MNIHEHQAKELLKEFGAPVSKGVVIFSLSEIDKKIKELKSNKFVFWLDVYALSIPKKSLHNPNAELGWFPPFRKALQTSVVGIPADSESLKDATRKDQFTLIEILQWFPFKGSL